LNQHPYETLTPDVVMDALAHVGLMCDGRLLALSSYENRVYLLYLEPGGAVVAKFYRPERWNQEQILEEHAFAAQLAAAEIPMVAPLVLHGTTLHTYAGFYFSVSPRRGGRSPDLDDDEVLPWIGRLMARLHQVGAAQPFVHRPALDLQSFGYQCREDLLASPLMPMEVSREWAAATDEALQAVAQHPVLSGRPESEVTLSPIALLRTHGDCHPGNILWTPQGQADEGPHFVDLDDARTSVAVQDLWMLLAGDRAQRGYQLSMLVEGYEQIRPFNRRELALIEPLRTLRLVHYSAWLARRWEDPSFPINFPWFGSVNYWSDQIVQIREQCEVMAQPVLSI
jgi:Ser/Thr protein kinase RdoA (MazF antagonist)